MSDPVASVAAAGAATLPADWRDLLALTKPRVMTLVVFTGLCGLLAAPTHIHPVLAFTAILCIALGAGAAAALNQWYEADIDALISGEGFSAHFGFNDVFSGDSAVDIAVSSSLTSDASKFPTATMAAMSALAVGQIAVASGGTGAAIAMFHADGTMMARYPRIDELIGQNFAAAPLLQPASPPPPPGAPTVPAIPADMRQQPGGLGSLDDVRANFSDPNSIVTNLFPDPAVPYTPVRQMPMGPPPPPDPAFAPPA